MITLISFILVLGVLIFVHEFGHFSLAKKFKVGVLKFSLGFGPKLLGRKKDETEYLISAVPIGGYVKLLGEDPEEECADPEKSFSKQPLLRRTLIVAAGPAFNLLFATLLFIILNMLGVPYLLPHVGKINENSPAAEAGLLPGDKILAIQDKEVWNWEQLVEVIHKSAGQKLVFKVIREDKELDIPIVPRVEKSKNIFGEEIQIGLVGVYPSGDFAVKRYNPVVAVFKGVQDSYRLTSLTVLGMVKMIQGHVSLDNISGPIWIAKMTGEQAKRGLSSLIYFTALLSISLGILNILPIPVLDGGHLLFFGFEAILGKPLSVKKREIATQVGLIVIISLMILAFYNDFTRLLVK
ncbi:MAG: RIP metalloprotease RseP [Candidatus Tectomicrobia bacterium]|uniref:Zinc metalloprotease n=1 Tax=Tectimicrobiota bacterium TaxID=2528274 RepID=A0A933GM10_UNCTE|nr:RIP metalloprotease RseP [Candidatus Tectomicrobia bacterium]